jgi:hypothetical protein
VESTPIAGVARATGGSLLVPGAPAWRASRVDPMIAFTAE